VLIMSVNPASAGQSFIPSALGKITEVRRRIDASGRDIWLEVDGGVKATTSRRSRVRAPIPFVAGSAIFGEQDRAGAPRACARR
jgi:ribulose-phosphate 3-epimerase